MSTEPGGGASSSPAQQPTYNQTFTLPDLSTKNKDTLVDFLKANDSWGVLDRFKSLSVEDLKGRVSDILTSAAAPQAEGITLAAAQSLGLTGKINVKNLKVTTPTTEETFNGFYDLDSKKKVEGTTRFKSGNEFTGTYYEDGTFKVGLYRHKDPVYTFEGSYHENGYRKEGTYTWKNGESFTARFDEKGLALAGKRNYRNRDFYEGTFEKTPRRSDGTCPLIYEKGTYNWSDGRIFEGSFKNNLPLEGTVTWSDDCMFTGNLQEGKGLYTVMRDDGESSMSVTFAEVQGMRNDTRDLNTQGAIQ
jgi:hypothetical protein